MSISPLVLSSSFHNRPLKVYNERRLYFRLMTRDYDEAWMLPGHVCECWIHWTHQHSSYSSLASKWQQRNPGELRATVVTTAMLHTSHNSVRDSLITLQWVGPKKILIDSEIYLRKLVNYRAHVSAKQWGYFGPHHNPPLQNVWW